MYRPRVHQLGDTMTQKNLYGQWHKFEFRPPSHYQYLDSLDYLTQACFGLRFDQFESKSSSTADKFIEVLTYGRKIDLEFKNSPKHGRSFNRLVIQGTGLDTLSLDVGALLTYLENSGFSCTECHSKILIPSDMVEFSAIEKHFIQKAYTSDCKRVGPETDPSNGHARTWSVGARPNHRSLNTTHGKRVIFYEAAKVHPELEPGTTELELQLFGDAAQKFVYAPGIRDCDLTVKTLGVIRSYLSIRTLSGDSNVSRRPLARWWNNLVGKYDAIHLPRLDRKAPQLDNQVKAFKAMLYGRKQTLGESTMLETIAEFCRELGLTDRLLAVA